MKKPEENPEKLVSQIQRFIDDKREPDEIVKAQVSKINRADDLITLELMEDFNFYPGAMVTVNRMAGVIQDKYSNRLRISAREDFDFEEGDTVRIDSSLMNLVISRLEQTIDRIKDDKLDMHNHKNLQFILGAGDPGYSKHNVIFKSETLNQSQQEAVNRSVNARNFHLIVGPPGTGKTYVITEILEQLLHGNSKILVTAWTNIAVDNILEKFQHDDSDKILRIGSYREVSPGNRKFTLIERRKKSSDYWEVEELDKLIEKQYKGISKLHRQRKMVRQVIGDLQKKKANYQNTIKAMKATYDFYTEKSQKYKVEFSGNEEKLADLEAQWSRLDEESRAYSDLASHLLELEKLDESLTDVALFNELESEISKAKSGGFVKKITSRFKGGEYEKFQKELEEKEQEYEKIRASYDHYWNQRDRVEEEYMQFYGDDYGYPYNDSIKIELQLVKFLGKYLSLKRDVFSEEMSGGQDLIYEAYQMYLSNLKKNMDIVREEVEFLDEDLLALTWKHDRILEDIKSLEMLIEVKKNDRNILLASIDQEILFKAQVVVATVISSANPVLKDQSFEWVMMDEASQVASFMSLIPLLKTRKFVLVGDDKQLQPIEESRLSAQLNLSIFNRLIEYFPDSSTFLDTQYRMNKEICDIASELFYDGKLKTFPEISHQTLQGTFRADGHGLLNPETPITYLDTCNIEYLEDEVGSGCENSKEAEFVVQLVGMLQDEGIQPEDIGVITPYRRHKVNIQKKLTQLNNGDGEEIVIGDVDGDINVNEKNEKRNTKGDNGGYSGNYSDGKMNEDGVEVDTVYRFQGREKDVIILTFCNSKLGRLKPYLKKFIEKPSQLNVAVTRARKKLIIVGNSKTLKESKLLLKFIDLIGPKNTVRFTDEDSNT